MIQFSIAFLLGVGILTILDRPWMIVVGCILLIIYSIVAYFKKMHGATLVGGFLGGFLLAGGSVFLNALLFEKEPVLGGVLHVTGTIVDVRAPGRYLFESSQGGLRSYRSDRDYPLGTILYTTAYVTTKSEMNDEQTLFSSTGYVFDYSRWLRMKGRQGAVRESQALILGKSDSLLLGFKQSLRDLAINGYDQDHYAGLVLGMTIGDRSLLSKDLYQQFIDAGVVHVIAVSGGNIVLLIAVMSALLFRVPFYFRLIVLSMLLIGYATLCGRDSSVMRATLMGLMTLLALFSGRIAHIRRTLMIVLIVMLVRNPYYLRYDLGFIFSFSAVVGILVIQSRFADMPSWLLPLIPVFGGTLGTLPLLIFFTSSFNILSLISNILILPLMPILMIGGIGSLMGIALTGWGYITVPIIRVMDLFYMVSSFTTQYGIYLVVDNLWIKCLGVVIGWTLLMILWKPSKTVSTPDRQHFDASRPISSLF